MVSQEKIKKVEKFIVSLKKEQRISLLGAQKISEFKNSPDFADFAAEKEDVLTNANGTSSPRLLGVLTRYVYVQYNTLVARLVRLAYELDDELAILRQRDAKPEEFAAYNEYVEYCKLMAEDYVTFIENLKVGS